MRHHTFGRIAEHSERAADWLEVYGSLTVPLLGPIPEAAFGPDGELETFYRVDVEQLTDEQIERAARFVSRRFDIDVDDARQGIRGGEGIPVLTEDVVVETDWRLLI